MGMDNVLKYLLELDASGVVGGTQAAEQAFQSFFQKFNAASASGAGASKPIKDFGDAAKDASGHAEGLVGGLEKGQHAIEQLMGSVATGSFTGIAQGLAGIAEAAGPLLLVAGAGIAIYEAFHLVGESVDEAVKWNLEAGKLSRQLGITTEDASVLANVLEDNGIATATYTTAVNFMTRAVANGSPAFAQLGVATREADGSLRPMNETFTDVMDKLRALPDPAARAVLGQQLLGRSWKESQELLRINSETLAENKKQMEELGTVVTPQTEAASRKYSLAVAEVHDVLNAFAINLGNAVIPTLTQLMHWFAEIGTQGVVAFRTALSTIGDVISTVATNLGTIGSSASAIAEGKTHVDDLTASLQHLGETSDDATKKSEPLFRSFSDVTKQMSIDVAEALGWLKIKFEDFVDWITTGFKQAGNVIEGWAVEAKAAISGNWIVDLLTGKRDTADQLIKIDTDYQSQDELLREGFNARSLAREKAYQQDLLKLKYGVLDEGGNVLDSGDMGPAKEEKKKGKGIDVETKDRSGELVKKWKEELDEIKALRENWFTWDTQRELLFWEEKLQHVFTKNNAYKAIMAEVVKNQQKLTKEQTAAEESAIRSELAAQKRASDEEIAIFTRTEDAKADARKNKGSVQETVIKGKSDIALINADEREKSAIIMATMKAEAAAADALAADEAAIRKEKLAGTLELNQKELDSTLAEYDKIRAIDGLSQQEHQKLTDDRLKTLQDAEKKKSQLLAAEDKAELKDEQAMANRKLKLAIATEAQIAQKKKEFSQQAEGYLQPFVHGFSDGIKKILNGTITLGQAVKGIGQMLVGALADMFGMMVEQGLQALAHLAAQWLANLIFGDAAEKASDATRMASGIAMRTSEATGMAAVGAVNAAASVAAIPMVGWAMAPEILASTYATLMGVAGLAAAAGGFDVPAGVNPLTQLHAEEMVLPKSLANAVRDMAKGGSSGNAGPAVTQHVHISTMDRQSFAGALKRHDSALRKELMGQARNGKFGRIGGAGRRK